MGRPPHRPVQNPTRHTFPTCIGPQRRSHHRPDQWCPLGIDECLPIWACVTTEEEFDEVFERVVSVVTKLVVIDKEPRGVVPRSELEPEPLNAPAVTPLNLRGHCCRVIDAAREDRSISEVTFWISAVGGVRRTLEPQRCDYGWQAESHGVRAYPNGHIDGALKRTGTAWNTEYVVAHRTWLRLEMVRDHNVDGICAPFESAHESARTTRAPQCVSEPLQSGSCHGIVDRVGFDVKHNIDIISRPVPQTDSRRVHLDHQAAGQRPTEFWERGGYLNCQRPWMRPPTRRASTSQYSRTVTVARRSSTASGLGRHVGPWNPSIP